MREKLNFQILRQLQLRTKVSTGSYNLSFAIHFHVVCVSPSQQKLNTDSRKMCTVKLKLSLYSCMRLHASNFGIQFLFNVMAAETEIRSIGKILSKTLVMSVINSCIFSSLCDFVSKVLDLRIKNSLRFCT